MSIGRGGLSNPLYLHQRPFGALVQSNKVYLPRMYIAHDSGLAARQINAIRLTSLKEVCSG